MGDENDLKKPFRGGWFVPSTGGISEAFEGGVEYSDVEGVPLASHCCRLVRAVKPLLHTFRGLLIMYGVFPVNPLNAVCIMHITKGLPYT